MDSKIKSETLSISSSINTNKAVIVRVKRKADQSPLEAFWLEINERPVKRPLVDFLKLSISASSTPEELKTNRVLVQHVETVSSCEATFHFIRSFVQPTSDDDSKFKASTKERRRTFLKENKHDQLLSKAKQEQEEIAKTARFEQIWKRRTRNKDVVRDGALDEVCRVYYVQRIDKDETSRNMRKQEQISAEDQDLLGKFLPLLRDCIPDVAEEIESDLCSHACQQDSGDEYAYDLYAVKENTNEAEASYPFHLVQVDDDDQYYDGPGDSEYETDDTYAEDHPNNDYPEEEYSEEEEERSSKSGSEPEEESEAETDYIWTKSEGLVGYERAEDPFPEEDEMYDSHSSTHSDDEDNIEDWRWAYR